MMTEECKQKLAETARALIADFYEVVERDVPDSAKFETIYVQLPFKDESLPITDIGFMAKQPLTRNPEECEGKLLVDLNVYNLPMPYKGCVCAFWGTKEDLLKELKTDKIFDLIMSRVPGLAEGLNDMR